MNCIERAAWGVYSCSQIEEAEKLKLIAAAAIVQGRADGISWDGYWFWDGSVQQEPVLLDAESFAKRIGDEQLLEQLFEFKFKATRFMSYKLLKKYFKVKSEELVSISALQSFLIE